MLPMRKKTVDSAASGATSCRRSCGGGKRLLAKIKLAKKVVEQRAREKAAAEGKSAGEAKQAKPEDKDQYNFTDPESRIINGADGFVQGYNAQAAVEPEMLLIAGQSVTEAPNQAATGADGGSHRATVRAAPERDCGRRVLFGREPGVRTVCAAHAFCATLSGQAVVSIAASVVPEGLPALITVTLAIAERRHLRNRCLCATSGLAF